MFRRKKKFLNHPSSPRKQTLHRTDQGAMLVKECSTSLFPRGGGGGGVLVSERRNDNDNEILISVKINPFVCEMVKRNRSREVSWIRHCWKGTFAERREILCATRYDCIGAVLEICYEFWSVIWEIVLQDWNETWRKMEKRGSFQTFLPEMKHRAPPPTF